MDKFRVIFSHGAGLLDLELLLLVNSTMIHCLHLLHWTATFGGLFGTSQPASPAPGSVPSAGPWARSPQVAPAPPPQQGYAQPQQGYAPAGGGMMGGGMMGGGMGGGGFLRSAAATASLTSSGAMTACCSRRKRFREPRSRLLTSLRH